MQQTEIGFTEWKRDMRGGGGGMHSTDSHFNFLYGSLLRFCLLYALDLDVLYI